MSHQRDRVAELEARIERIEAALGLDDVAPIADQHFDERDARVLAALRECKPEKVHVRDLRKLYKRKTDIRRRETLSDRVRTLTEHGPFERAGRQKWRYTGDDS